MSGATIRPAFASWPNHHRRLRDRVATLTEEDLALRPSADRWPLWASIGHLACQRVFGLCDVALAPGAAASPFPNAGYDCPGDDDLETIWTGPQLVAALDATFEIVEWCLDNWTLDDLAEVIRHDDWGAGWDRTRGETLQRAYAHDVWHVAELNEALGAVGLEQVDFWS